MVIIIDIYIRAEKFNNKNLKQEQRIKKITRNYVQCFSKRKLHTFRFIARSCKEQISLTTIKCELWFLSTIYTIYAIETIVLSTRSRSSISIFETRSYLMCCENDGCWCKRYYGSCNSNDTNHIPRLFEPTLLFVGMNHLSSVSRTIFPTSRCLASFEKREMY